MQSSKVDNKAEWNLILRDELCGFEFKKVSLAAAKCTAAAAETARLKLLATAEQAVLSQPPQPSP
jgi:hypothetical protein